MGRKPSLRKVSDVREKLIEAGVKHLKNFGYPNVNSTNILTDYVYAQFFKGMLEGTIGHRANIDKACRELIEEINKIKLGDQP